MTESRSMKMDMIFYIYDDKKRIQLCKKSELLLKNNCYQISRKGEILATQNVAYLYNYTYLN